MPKKSFSTQLFQGFVRSAVNQVGRDGGKVISNQVYGNAHSAPIRGVSNHQRVEFQGRTITEDFSPEPWLSNKWYFYLLYPISIPFFFWILWPFTIARGIELVFSKNTKIKVPFKEPVYVVDRRYSDGKRLEGYRTNVQIFNVESPPEHRKRHIIKGIGYLILSIGMMIATWRLIKEFGWI